MFKLNDAKQSILSELGISALISALLVILIRLALTIFYAGRLDVEIGIRFSGVLPVVALNDFPQKFEVVNTNATIAAIVVFMALFIIMWIQRLDSPLKRVVFYTSLFAAWSACLQAIVLNLLANPDQYGISNQVTVIAAGALAALLLGAGLKWRESMLLNEKGK